MVWSLWCCLVAIQISDQCVVTKLTGVSGVANERGLLGGRSTLFFLPSWIKQETV